MLGTAKSAWQPINLFSEAASRASGAPLFVEGDAVRLTYAELDRAVGGYAAALVRLGTAPGDRILVQAEKSIEGALLYLASLPLGWKSYKDQERAAAAAQAPAPEAAPAGPTQTFGAPVSDPPQDERPERLH